MPKHKTAVKHSRQVVFDFIVSYKKANDGSIPDGDLVDAWEKTEQIGGHQ